MSSEREADRALKRLVTSLSCLLSILTVKQSAHSSGICSELGGDAGGEKSSLYVMLPTSSRNSLLTSLTRLQGGECVSLRYGPSWEHLIEFMRSYFRGTLALYSHMF